MFACLKFPVLRRTSSIFEEKRPALGPFAQRFNAASDISLIKSDPEDDDDDDKDDKEEEEEEEEEEEDTRLSSPSIDTNASAISSAEA